MGQEHQLHPHFRFSPFIANVHFLKLEPLSGILLSSGHLSYSPSAEQKFLFKGANSVNSYSYFYLCVCAPVCVCVGGVLVPVCGRVRASFVASPLPATLNLHMAPFHSKLHNSYLFAFSPL